MEGRELKRSGSISERASNQLKLYYYTYTSTLLLEQPVHASL